MGLDESRYVRKTNYDQTSVKHAQIGNAIFWRSSVFEFIKEKYVSYASELYHLMYDKKHQNGTVDNPYLAPQVAVIVQLHHRKTKKDILICTTHLSSDFANPKIQIAQVQVCLNEIANLGGYPLGSPKRSSVSTGSISSSSSSSSLSSSSSSSSSSISSSSTSSSFVSAFSAEPSLLSFSSPSSSSSHISSLSATTVIPVIFTGDYNSTPKSALYSLIATGQLNRNHPDWKKIQLKKILQIFLYQKKEKNLIIIIILVQKKKY